MDFINTLIIVCFIIIFYKVFISTSKKKKGLQAFNTFRKNQIELDALKSIKNRSSQDIENIEESLYNKWKTKNYFFSKAELIFYRELTQFSQNKNICIFPKVRIADLVTPKYALDNSTFMKVFLKLSQKHVDYVLTDTKGKILCVLELDGESHTYGKTLENDKFKNQFFEDIGLPLIRFQNYGFHNFSKISNIL